MTVYDRIRPVDQLLNSKFIMQFFVILSASFNNKIFNNIQETGNKITMEPSSIIQFEDVCWILFELLVFFFFEKCEYSISM